MGKLRCPDCGSDKVTLEVVDVIMANTYDLFVHSTKPQDCDSKSICLDCGWDGIRSELIGADDV